MMSLSAPAAEEMAVSPSRDEKKVVVLTMKKTESPSYGSYLKMLSTDEIEKLLSCVLQEMRSRDSDKVKGDVVSNSRALRKMRPAD